MDHLIQVLTKSVEKHGATKVVTLGHLLSLVRLADRLKEAEANRLEEAHQAAYNDAMADYHAYGTGD